LTLISKPHENMFVANLM